MLTWLSPKAMLSYKGVQYNADWIQQNTTELSERLYATSRGNRIALQLADPFEMALCFLASDRTGLHVYLLHPNSPAEKTGELTTLGVPIINTLETLTDERKCFAPGNTIIVFSTSSTTRFSSKWISIPYESLLMKSIMIRSIMNLSEHDVTYLISPLAFIQSCWALQAHLMAGSEVWIDSFSPRRLKVNLERITTLVTVPSIAGIMVKKQFRIGNLRLLILGGDFANKALIDGMIALWPNLLYANVYGCTETSAADLILPPTLLGSGDKHLYSVGTPGWYSNVSIRDPQTQDEVADGQQGIIWVSGELVCPDVVSKENDFGFCTGDMAYRDYDGFHYFAGRSVILIKYNGQRISALEVENALVSCDKVLEAVVFGTDDSAYGQILNAAVRLSEPLTRGEIESELRKKLEPYKMPKNIYAVAEIKKTVSGKVCRIPAVLQGYCEAVKV